MSLSTYTSKPQPIAGGPVNNYSAVLDMENENERIALMKSMGAKNVDPPLPRSSHLINKKTGLILPWNEMLAEQRDVMENCDANGNTDPAAWMPTVIDRELTDDERMETLHAQGLAVEHGQKMSSGFRDMSLIDPYAKQEQGYPEGVAAIGDTRKEDVESMEAFNLLLERVDNGR